MSADNIEDLERLDKVMIKYKLWEQNKIRSDFDLATIPMDKQFRFNLGGTHISQEELRALEPIAPFVELLALEKTQIGRFMEELLPFRQLETLSLAGVQFKETRDLRYVAQLPCLTNLLLQESNLDDQGLENLAPLLLPDSPQLQTLVMSKTLITKEGVLRHVRGLKPRGTLLINSEGIKFSAEDLQHFRGWKPRKFGISNVTDESLETLFEGFEGLVRLHIGRGSNVSSKLVKRLEDHLRKQTDCASDFFEVDITISSQ